MSEPTPITIDQVREGDTVRVVRSFPSGLAVTTEGEVESNSHGEVCFVTGVKCRCEVLPGRYEGSTCTAYLIHRPPTRRAITLDDLKDWRSVPIGTRIELATEPFGKARAGKLTVRRETSESDEGWEFEVGGCWVQFSSIKPGTLFIIEEVKP